MSAEIVADFLQHRYGFVPVNYRETYSDMIALISFARSKGHLQAPGSPAKNSRPQPTEKRRGRYKFDELKEGDVRVFQAHDAEEFKAMLNRIPVAACNYGKRVGVVLSTERDYDALTITVTRIA